MAGVRKSELTGALSAFAQKRISKERRNVELEREELEKCGIFLHWGDQVHKAIALIVGPEGTPYENGFYFFDIQIPDNYPLQPPHVDFKTGDGRVRFNPNLYVEGKVCLSILGTWSGPSWTTSCTLRTVLISIQSLLSEHPIQNEPGHEKETGKDDKAYTEIIRYENIAVGVVRMLKETPAKFAAFRPQMRKIFLHRIEDYFRTLKVYESKEGQSTRSPIWGFPVRFRPRELRGELEALRDALLKEEEEEIAEGMSSPEGELAASAAAADGAVGSAAEPAVDAGGAAPSKRPSGGEMEERNAKRPREGA